MDNAKSELIKKLYEMVNHDNGNDNEKANAQRILNKLMRESGITEVDLQGLDESEHIFKYNTKRDRLLLFQIIVKVTNLRKYHSYTKGGRLASRISITHTQRAGDSQVELASLVPKRKHSKSNFFTIFIISYGVKKKKRFSTRSFKSTDYLEKARETVKGLVMTKWSDCYS